MGPERYSIASIRDDNGLTLYQHEDGGFVDGNHFTNLVSNVSRTSLVVRDSHLFIGAAVEGNRVTLLTPARKCSHGVEISSSQRQLFVRQAAASSDICVFIDQEYHLWYFPLSAVAQTIEVEKVPLLQTRVVRKINCGKSHIVALVEEMEKDYLNESAESDEGDRVFDDCPKCSENARLRLSVLKLEADKAAEELELQCDSWEIESITSSGSICRSQRKKMSRMSRLSDVNNRPTSLPLFPESSLSLPNSVSFVNPGDISLSFVSMDTIHLEEKRREYESQSDEVQVPKKETSDMEVQGAMEVWVWGANDEGQLGLGDTLSRKWPTRLVSLDNSVLDVSCGDYHCSALTVTGEVYFWGRNISHACADKLFFERPRLLKLGPEQFVFRHFSLEDSTWLLLAGREKTTSLCYCGNNSSATRAVTRIPQNDKLKISVDFGLDSEFTVLQVQGTSLVLQVLEIFHKAFRLSRLLKGLLEIFQSLNSRGEDMSEEISEMLSDLSSSSSRFYKLVCSLLLTIVDIFLKLSQRSLVRTFELFASTSFISCCEAFVTQYSTADAYESINSTQLIGEMEKTVERLALEFGVDSTTPQTTIKNLIAEVLQFLTFISLKARESLTEIEEESLRTTLQKALRQWKKTNNVLQKTLSSGKKTKREAWSNPRLASLKQPGRLLLDCFRIGQDQDIKTVTFEQPRYLLQPRVIAIYVFQDCFVTEESRGLKTSIRSFPLHLVWAERGQDNVVTLKTPEVHFTLEFNKDSNWFIGCCSYWYDHSFDSSQLPTIRKGTFEFSPECPREHLRQKRYTGHWKNAQLHGRGKLEDLVTGDVQDGIFDEDRLQGFGQMFQTVPSGSTSSFYVEPSSCEKMNFFRGIFDHGSLTGLAKIRYANGSSYDGYVKDGKPHGFGVRKFGLSTHVGDFREGVEAGYGVSINNREKRMGEFSEGKLNGRGTVINIDGCVFEGTWVSDKMKRGRIITCPGDGSDALEYEGDTDVSDRRGDIGKQGRLKVSKNIYLQGSFTGNILRGEIRVLDATITSAIAAVSPVRSMLCGDGPVLSEWAVPVYSRWTPMFDIFKLEEIGESISTTETWSRIVRGMIEGKQLVYGDVSTGFCDSLERIPDYEAPWNSEYYSRAAEYWRLAHDNAYHPLRRLLNGITEVLTASYSDISAHRIMYDHCVLEARYLIEETYFVVRMLFPNLPENPWAHAPVWNESMETISSPDSSPEKKYQKKCLISVPVPCCDFIVESFFVRCAPILFTIYSLYNSEREDKYWGKAVYLNAHTDVKLLTHLGVEREVWPIAISSENTRDLDRPIIVTTARDKFYRRAVDSLQRLPSETNPSAKLRILTDTYTIMEQCIAEQTEVGKKHVFSADSLLPAFIYVVIRAQIRHLGSEILCLDDFSRDWRGDGAIGLLFTNLQSAYLYICNEKSLV